MTTTQGAQAQHVRVRDDGERWRDRYVRRLRAGDAAAILVAVSAAYLLRFTDEGPAYRVTGGEFAPTYLAVAAALVGAWLVALAVAHAWDRHNLGAGSAEYAAVFGASWRLFAVVAIVAYLAKMEIGRAFLAIAFPVGVALLLLERLGARHWLRRQRLRGHCRTPLLVVGQREQVANLVREVEADPAGGLAVVGACVPGGTDGDGDTVDGVPVLGDLPDAAAQAHRVHAGAVAVTGADQLTARVVRRLGWDLESTDAQLLVGGSLTDIAGPRIHVTPVAGLPLMAVDQPRFTGPKYVVKSVADWLGALLLTVVLSPLLVTVALAIRLGSPGPALFRHERVGRSGRTFPMLKFRTMVDGAEARRDDVMSDGRSGLYYKRRDDPRVTRLGAWLRRYSLDELPQLLNVLRGEMSLVGPRPQVADEVALYDRAAHRRLLVKPGMTGLWQVSGRSDLSPDESIRKDVYYVENWTLFGDVMIVARTARAVLSGTGAY